jgi:enoyl-CoA hydratase/carnithine racemase
LDWRRQTEQENQLLIEVTMADEILCTVQDGIATLTLNRPEKRNALNTTALEQLTGHLDTLEHHKDVRVVCWARLT